MCHTPIDTIDPGSNFPLWQTFCPFFLPFEIANHTRKAFIFNKNEGNNQKVENKISGRIRVGVGKALLSQ